MNTLKSTFQAYVEDSRSHTTDELKQFYDNRGMVVLLRPYALACGYVDVWHDATGKWSVILDTVEGGAYRLRVTCRDEPIKAYTFISGTFIAMRSKQKKYIAMLSVG